MDQGYSSRSSARGHRPDRANRLPAPEFGAILTLSPPAAARELHLAIRLDNYDLVSRQFGERHAEKLKNAVCNSLRALGNHPHVARAVVLPGEDGLIGAIFVSDRMDCHVVVHAACVLIAMTPVNVGRTTIVPVLSFGVAPPEFEAPEDGRDAALLAAARGNIAWLGRDVAPFGQAQEQDLSTAASFLEAVSRNEVLFRWQPVRDADDPCEILYHHVSVCRVHDQALPVGVAEEIAAIERVGASPAFDCYAVSRAIDELQHAPHLTLAVTISGRSATSGFWWTEVLARLASDRLLGPRLFLNIGDSAPLPEFGALVKFVDMMRLHGCRIGIDRFGAGYSSIRAIMALKPDIITIDPQFLARALQGEADRTVFDHITGLAAAISRAVVAAGVDNERTGRLARDAGINWQQGYHHGAPSVVRAWTAGSAPRQIAALESFCDAFRNAPSAVRARGDRP